MSAPYILHGSFLSAPTYKVGLMLALTGQPFDYRHVDLSKGQHKTPDFLALNRYGQVPVLQHGSLTLCQSNAILEYLAEQTGRFGGGDPVERQRCREWLCWSMDRLEPGLFRTRFFERFVKPDPAVHAYMRKNGEMGLGVLNDLLQGRDWLVGSAATYADIGVFGAVVHAAEGKFDLGAFPHIAAWQQRVAALPGFQLPYDLLPKG